MIDKIIGSGIKGLAFEQSLGQLTLFMGPNGSGKSARSHALILALLGYIPGAQKTNAEILESFGDGEKMGVGFQVGATLFERGYVLHKESVQQAYKVNGKKVPAKEFNTQLGVAGAPTAIDVAAFMALSDAKKIDVIFGLYPPSTNIFKLISSIEDTKDRINALNAKVKATEDAAVRLTTSRAALELPVGTLADVTRQIDEIDGQLAQARADLTTAETEEAVRLERARAAKEAEDKRIEDVRKLLARAKAVGIEQSAIKRALRPDASNINLIEIPVEELSVYVLNAEKAQAEAFKPAVTPPAPLPGPVHSAPAPIAPVVNQTAPICQPIDSIQAILDALNSAGCTACAARLVAMRELKKYRMGVAA